MNEFNAFLSLHLERKFPHKLKKKKLTMGVFPIKSQTPLQIFFVLFRFDRDQSHKLTTTTSNDNGLDAILNTFTSIEGLDIVPCTFL